VSGDVSQSKQKGGSVKTYDEKFRLVGCNKLCSHVFCFVSMFLHVVVLIYDATTTY